MYKSPFAECASRGQRCAVDDKLLRVAREFAAAYNNIGNVADVCAG